MKLPCRSNAAYWSFIKQWASTYSDGCSGVADIYVRACWEHDYHYRYARTVAGEPITRAQADARFRQVVQWDSPAHRFSPLSWWRWAGLRLFARRAWSNHRRND